MDCDDPGGARNPREPLEIARYASEGSFSELQPVNFETMNNISAMLSDNSEMDTYPLNSGSDSDLAKDKVKLINLDLSDFNKKNVQCRECGNNFQMDNPLWGINQMNTRKINCRVCDKSFLIKAVLETKPKFENGTLQLNSAVAVYTTSIETGIKQTLPCINCKTMKEITTLPIDELISEEWFICKCGKNQCARIKYTPGAEYSPLTTRKMKKNKNRRSKSKQMLASRSLRTANALATDKTYEPTRTHAPVHVHLSRTKENNGTSAATLPSQATLTATRRERDNTSAQPRTRDKDGNNFKSHASAETTRKTEARQSTLDAWKVSQPIPPPPSPLPPPPQPYRPNELQTKTTSISRSQTELKH